MSLHDDIRSAILANLEVKHDDEIIQLNNALRLLAKHRCVLIQNTFIKNNGLSVLQGPFAGLNFLKTSAEGCHIPKLLGCYEQPLLPYIEKAIEGEYQAVVNIGSAEGYYAVGMALRMPNAVFHAFDLSDAARAFCYELAKSNNVSERVQIGSLFETGDFDKFRDVETLILCDIEGGEVDLLDPKAAPSLKKFDIIVEAHEGDYPGTIQALLDRFRETHSVEIIYDSGHRYLYDVPSWFLKLSHLDQLLATWEWRSASTPWLIMTKIKPD